MVKTAARHSRLIVASRHRLLLLLLLLHDERQRAKLRNQRRINARRKLRAAAPALRTASGLARALVPN
jgi:hypothetical protein